MSLLRRAMEPLLIDEETATPHTAYAISKYAIELLAARLAAATAFDGVLRYTYVQGRAILFTTPIRRRAPLCHAHTARHAAAGLRRWRPASRLRQRPRCSAGERAGAGATGG